MRPVLLGDVVAAARALRPLPAGERPAFLARLVSEARAAAAHGRSTGRNHPEHGDGSLMAAALCHPCVPEPPMADAEYRRCLVLVLQAVPM